MKSLRLHAALAAAALVAGCSTAPAPVAPGGAGPTALEPSGTVVAVDAGAGAAVACAALQERELPDGRLEVAASLSGRGSGPLHPRVRCVFEDSSGAVLGATEWREVALAGRRPETVRFASSDARAKRCTVEVGLR